MSELNRMDVTDKFEALEQDSGGGSALSALPLPGSGTHYLAKGSAGEPVLLLRVQKRRLPRIPLGLRHVHVEFEVTCAVSDGGAADGLITATYCRAACDPTTPGLHPLFIYALAGAVEGLPSNLTSGEVDRFFENAMELFRSFSAPAKSSVQGLWGELLVIAASPAQETLMTGWHVTPEQTFDFAFPRAHLEVKTTARQSRQHEFAFAQIRKSTLPTVVASIIVEQSDAGENVYELANAIQKNLALNNRAKLWRLVTESIGSEADGAGDIRFLRMAALNSLRFYDAAMLPAPEISHLYTECISAVRFTLDLDQVPNIMPFKQQDVWNMMLAD